jgi:hypothetical protein
MLLLHYVSMLVSAVSRLRQISPEFDSPGNLSHVFPPSVVNCTFAIIGPDPYYSFLFG